MKLSDRELVVLRRAKQAGFSDRQISEILSRKAKAPVSESDIRHLRKSLGLNPVFKSVDTCAGEFEAYTPYYYSTYERENESKPSGRKRIIILGGGPNRIGQGIEFDYCCVHAVFALKDEGYEAIMINSNPETVSTDYDTADKLYFEPLTVEDVMAVCDLEQPDGVIVQLGGQTPLKLARDLEREGVNIIGTSPESIDIAEDRDRFGKLLANLNILQPANATGLTIEEVKDIAESIGYPVMVRPSYVLGGRAMQIVYNDDQLVEFAGEAIRAADGHPILVDKYLENAVEVDVDALADGNQVVVAGIMQHIEEAGIHSGDSACVIPTTTISPNVLEEIRETTDRLGRELKVMGLMNIQYAVRDESVYVLEVNPRASRTVPFVSKTIGVPIAKHAARIMVGRTLEELEFTEEPKVHYFSVKEAVLPFHKFPGCSIRLGPEMRSTGEVMGIDRDYATAFAKSQSAATGDLPVEGIVFVSISDKDKSGFLPIATKLRELGFEIIATSGTSKYLKTHHVSNQFIYKISEGRPNVLDRAMNHDIAMIINTFSHEKAIEDENKIRSIAVQTEVPLITTISAARSVVDGISAMKSGPFEVRPIQEYHAELLARTCS
jgi:carbamoyl-phosphate synthase large subunit